MIVRSEFGCAHCGELWTPPLRRVPAWIDDDSRPECCSDAPAGWWSLRPDPHNRPEHPVALNILDARGLTLHEEVERVVGCCGVGFRQNKPNLRCGGCRREVAFRLSDGDHCNHAIFVAATPRTTRRYDEPDDEALRARFERRFAVTEIAPEDAGMDALPARLRASQDALWDNDIQRAELFPPLLDLAVSVTGRQVRLALDGVWVRPAWPEGERDRVLALGAIPQGNADEPLTWWCDLVTGSGGRDRHQWWQWCVGGELCVAWQRGPEGRFEDVPLVAFRVLWELWALAWREALAR